MLEDGAEDRGSVTSVRRVGETIRRPAGEWTAAVHALLRHLTAAGFTRAPRAIGTEGSEEIVSFLRGEPAYTPWPRVLRTDDGVAELARWLRDYHAAVADFRPPPGAVWQAAQEEWRPGMIVRHGDLGPWNAIWDGGRLTGFIDWDFAAPGTALDDLAQLAWYAVPLRPPGDRATAVPDDPAAATDDAPGLALVRRRLERLCAAYGTVPPSAVLDALDALQTREADRIDRLGALGTEPWAMFRARGDADDMRAEREWARSVSHDLADRT